MDALADEDEQIDKSPYAYAWNNPVNLTDPDGNCPKCGEFLKGVGRGVASGFGRTVDFVKRDAWKAQTWKNTGNLALGLVARAGNPTGGNGNLAAMDAALGTNTAGGVSGLEGAIAAGADKIANGNAGQRGEVVGEALYGIAEAVVGSKGAGLAVKGVEGVSAVASAEKLLGPSLSKLAGQGIEAAGAEGAVVGKNFDRFLNKIPSNSKGSATWTTGDDGLHTFSATSPGKVPGSSAQYQKTVNSSGTTVGYKKTTTTPSGHIAHIKDKLNGN